MVKLVRLTEGDLHKIVDETVSILMETDFRQVNNLNDYI